MKDKAKNDRMIQSMEVTMKTITSTQNAHIKELCKLHSKKGRDNTQMFLIEGEHLIQEADKANCLIEVLCLENEEISFDTQITYVSQQVLNKLSVQKSNAKIIGVAKRKMNPLKSFGRILLLNRVQDPGNVGTIIRTAYSFGYDACILDLECADITNPKTIQASQGAIFHLPCITANLCEWIEQHPEVSTYATSLHEPYQNLSDIKPKIPYALILGNEGQGVSQDLLSICDTSIKIEMDTFESLNVSIAAAICMYKFKYD